VGLCILLALLGDKSVTAFLWQRRIVGGFVLYAEHFVSKGNKPAKSFSGSSPTELMTIFYCLTPRNRVAQLYPQALVSLFVASYESQGYGGGIRTRLHSGTNS
jgi:hypothetical protein